MTDKGPTDDDVSSNELAVVGRYFELDLVASAAVPARPVAGPVLAALQGLAAASPASRWSGSARRATASRGSTSSSTGSGTARSRPSSSSTCGRCCAARSSTSSPPSPWPWRNDPARRCRFSTRRTATCAGSSHDLHNRLRPRARIAPDAGLRQRVPLLGAALPETHRAVRLLVDQIDGVLPAIPEAQDLGATVVLSPADVAVLRAALPPAG